GVESPRPTGDGPWVAEPGNSSRRTCGLGGRPSVPGVRRSFLPPSKNASRVPNRDDARFLIHSLLYHPAKLEVMTHGDFRIRPMALGGGLESFSGGLDFTIEIVRMASEATRFPQVLLRVTHALDRPTDARPLYGNLPDPPHRPAFAHQPAYSRGEVAR